jgi:hypothetical protein
MPLPRVHQRAQLLANGKTNARRIAADQEPLDFVPVVKLFTPDAGATCADRARSGGRRHCIRAL